MEKRTCVDVTYSILLIRVALLSMKFMTNSDMLFITNLKLQVI